MDIRPTKILYLLDKYEHPYGGTERQLLELIKNLDRRLYEPRMAVLRESDYLKSHDFVCPVDVLNIDRIADIRSFRSLYNYARKLKRSGFSLAQIFFNDASIIGPPVLKLTGFKIIISRRDMGFWYTRMIKRLLKLNRIFVDHVIVNSEAVARSVGAAESYKGGKITVIYNGYNAVRSEDLEVDSRRSLGIGALEPIIGIVANLRPIKRIDDLIKAFSVVARQHTNAWLVIVGGGELKQSLELLAEALEVRNRIVFTGQVSDVLSIVREFNIGVLCSESEGFSNSIIEYMSCGKPVVCTNVGGNPEIVENGRSGFLIEVGDIDELAGNLCRLLDESELTEDMGRNALARVQSKYSVEKMVNEHMELYAKLVA